MAPQHVFEVEYAKSGRAACKQCKSKIDKDALRLGHKMLAQTPGEGTEDSSVRAASHMMESTKWYHRDCFSLMKGKAWFKKNLPENANGCSGFEALQREDQELVTMTFAICRGEAEDGGILDTPTPAKKRDAPSDAEVGSAQKQAKLETSTVPNAVQGVLSDDQFKAFQAAKDLYAKKNVAQLQAMLGKNGLPKSGAKPALIERAAEGKALGVPPVCPTCDKGRLQFSRVTGSISCPGFFDDDAKRFKKCKGPAADYNMVRAEWQEQLL
eukprot:gnl/MRDRNA2_/MRDRNA2_91024_c0_seq1.p1 gnl/MRDRNA2_/MRDRNA2_91024_c0~~gnl/MRDRNA2_/MRDRNA2_91024_c0_seq1.p1  ORF type:complete len:269 (+),score=72.53 gnl/MRDRNA2_/MRDRNA2_91024_c0_seq1:86-892(+)